MIITINLRDDLPTLEKRRALAQIAKLLSTMAETVTQATRASGEEVTLETRSGETVATLKTT